jgi:hypothetical protein
MDTGHQIVWQVSGPVLCVLGDVPCLSPQGVACTKQIHSRSRRREQEPARLDPSLPSAPSLRGICDVRKSLCEIDQSLGEPIDVSHSDPFSPFELVKPLARRVSRQKTVSNTAFRGLMDKLQTSRAQAPRVRA